VKFQKLMSLFLLTCTLGATSIAQASVAASEASVSSALDIQQFSADDRNDLGLDALTDAQDLEKGLAWGPYPGPRPGPRPWPRPRPYPPRPFPPRPYPPRPAPVPYLTCFATDAYGYSFSASGYGYPQQVQQAAMNACFQRSNYGCRPAGCR
jgi:hypothetical protein